MFRGDISALQGLSVMVDLECLLDPPKALWKRKVLQLLNRFPKVAWHIQSFTIGWRTLNREAVIFAFWMLEQSISIVVIVRSRNSFLLRRNVSKILGDEEPAGYPHLAYGYIEAYEKNYQALAIDTHAKSILAARFYTSDKELVYRLPPVLVKFVENWAEVKAL